MAVDVIPSQSKSPYTAIFSPLSMASIIRSTLLSIPFNKKGVGNLSSVGERNSLTLSIE